ncbi:MAG TPA: sugar transferase [Candidatus Methylomirabilis sp.]|nr:sugar transferase [Candidatus Methylomirabilis sp.]
MGNKFKSLILLGGDILIMYLSLYLALLIRYDGRFTAELWQRHLGPFAIIFFIWFLIFYISSLYNLKLASNDTAFYRRLARSFLAATLLSIIFFYLAPPSGITPKTNFFVFVAVFAILLIGWRRLFNLVLKSYLPKNNLAIIGQHPLIKEIVADLKQKPQLGFNISFIASEALADRELDGVPVYDNLAALPDLIAKRKINNIILASAPDSQELRALLFECLPLKITFINLDDFYETIAGKIPLEVLNQMWFLENLNEGNKSGFDLFKRLADLILALIIFLVTLPFWLIIALIIKLESRGPVFFVQTRAGERGKNFRMIKFRTMKIEGNDQTPTADGDHRVTRFGSFLRQSRLDEIPQVLNIIKGEMSFVGPRPERPELIAALEKQVPFYRERMLVKPGVTGWDQISGEYHSPSYEDTMKKLQYDLYYIKNRSIYLELSIILKTIATVLSRAGR